jgi:hypothetical protein
MHMASHRCTGLHRLALLAAMAALPLPALAQSAPPPGADPATGARPGNAIGTGMSLPLSDKAGNIAPAENGPPYAARLPDPAVGEDASVPQFLLAARGALAAGRTGEAQEALERAQTRVLDRSVPLFRTGEPIRDPLVERIHAVLMALGGGDRMQAMQLLEQAIAQAQAAR